METAIRRDTRLILGVGNPVRGDDGVGLVVLTRLKSHALPEGTALIDGGTAGLEIVLELIDRSTVLVIDAARFGGAKGEVRRFDLLETELPRIQWNVGHAHGLAAAVELAKALGIRPRRLGLYAVEPSSIEVPNCLSESVERAVPIVVSRILDELTRLDAHHPP